LTTKNKILSSILGIFILATTGAIVYVANSPPARGTFTEFYILATDGKAEGYPEELAVGEEGRVILGIVNHEYQEIYYRVIIQINGVQNQEIGPVVLEHKEQWEQEVSFIPNTAGEDVEVEFLLYKEKEGQLEYADSLRFSLDIKEKE